MRDQLGKTAGGIWHKPYHDWLLDNINSIITRYPNMDVQERFLDYYPRWISSSKNNQFTGLEYFPQRYISVGVTQAIDDFNFYCSKNSLRLRVFRGEYPYSKNCSNWVDENWIENSPLVNGDAVIISTPFSATGNKHEQYDWLIAECNSKNIPVFVDCAFFGACSNIHVKLDEPCIDTVAFSTTKGLSAANYRSGIVFTKRSGKDSSLDIQTQYQNGIHLNVAITLGLMREFGPDTLYNCYSKQQHNVCKALGLEPSNTIQLGLGGSEYSDYSRDGVANRVNIKNILMQHSPY